MGLPEIDFGLYLWKKEIYTKQARIAGIRRTASIEKHQYVRLQ